MLTRAKSLIYLIAFVVILSSFPVVLLHAEDLIEKGGVAVGVTAGNWFAIPAKVASVSIGVLSGALSFLVTGGNADLTKQIWQDTTQGPYLITPELAEKAVGQRPLLQEKTGDMQPPPNPAQN
jgi:hypothetical protein